MPELCLGRRYHNDPPDVWDWYSQPVDDEQFTPKPDGEKMTLAGDVLFDFDKCAIEPAGTERLDELVGKISAVYVEVVIASGHTDSIGSDAHNQKLSLRRAESVKAYLVSKGIEPNRIYTEGKGAKQPVAADTINGQDNPAGRQKNRRVAIEVIGLRKN